LTFILLYCFAQLALVIQYIKAKRHPKQHSFPQKGAWEDWPVVTIQLPIFNEKYVIARLIDHVVAMDYPLDKLEIQVLDDSNDETVSIVREKVNLLQKEGFDIHHICRGEQTDFKAGALKYGLAQAKGDFVAIFDADFMPDRQFLKVTLGYFKNPETGVVQTRWGHLNENYSLLTKLQSYALNAHFTIEQVGRNSAGHFINFNGTAGIWRKETIIDAGGWEGDTLTEDLDLSYRAQLKGWKFVYLEDFFSPAELPAEMNALKSQQFRWAKGAAECTRKNLMSVLRASDIRFSTKIFAIFHLLNSVTWISLFVTGLLLCPFMLIVENNPQYNSFFGLMSIYHLSFIILFLFYTVANSGENLKRSRDYLRFLWHYPAFLSLALGISLNNAIGVFEGFLGKKSSFIRTPKFNIIDEQDSIAGKTYVTYKISLVTVLEFVCLLYFTFGIFLSIDLGQFLATPFFVMMAGGFGVVLFYSYSHAVFSRRMVVKPAN
ncbi:MAG: glycosyltransferase family 2 protein, partial [Bacteroidetes bacterium]|nr:glycosyltransferase family 2 protein [Bacteroidota bacterium]